MTAPTTSTLQCLSAEKAAELAARLVADCGCPATASGSELTAPIDDIGFVFHIAEIAAGEGYASDDDAGAFQSAGMNLAEGHR